MNIDNTRILTSTIKNGRVHFGQAIMEQQADPLRVILVALDPDFGLIYWECYPSVLKPHTRSQHRGYSRYLPPFPIDDEPAFLGESYKLAKDKIENWSEIMGAHARAKNYLIREIFA